MSVSVELGWLYPLNLLVLIPKELNYNQSYDLLLGQPIPCCLRSAYNKQAGQGEVKSTF
jgi:hypothetical protein